MESYSVLIERHGQTINGTYEILPDKTVKVSAIGLKSRVSLLRGMQPKTIARIVLADMYDDAKLREEWFALNGRRAHGHR